MCVCIPRGDHQKRKTARALKSFPQQFSAFVFGLKSLTL
jgi:hypothetical protein